jgi:thioredoxin 1
VLAAGLPTLLVFEKPICDPCKSLVPTLKNLAQEFSGRVLVVQVDNAEEGNLAARFRINRVPTLIYWRQGNEVTRVEGAANAAVVRANLEFLLGAGQPTPAGNAPSIPLVTTATYHTQPSQAAPTPGQRDGSPVVVTDATFAEQILRSPLPVLVDFWAPWCGPCRMVSPIVEELGRQYAGRLRIAKVNTDENPVEAGRLGIMGIPTLIFFVNGREVDRVVGAAPKATLASHLAQVLKTTA